MQYSVLISNIAILKLPLGAGVDKGAGPPIREKGCSDKSFSKLFLKYLSNQCLYS